ncbi:MAG: ribonuclease activity regulator RraA [Proteobacteria bacterium]|jgi:regulator of RNase E activity RraA|nr:ribonuclease activity regulator RraA [Chloroflexota bacterium]NBP76740.1 ribonuclease activity regulator RraA [Pseudomonadota bacterium]NBQ31867.1 ribonuclease activity regulator RraA [Pseudomonadota bacterium]NBQ61778.1 ribonuclease activity regulator RraA [Pseudomonadota bacterium]NBT03910.1 ribonuclease activity regulator RraA [Pseudomonadota bacterium]
MTTRDSDEQIASNLKHGSVATLTHWLNTRGYRNAFIGGLLSVNPGIRMAGPARTIRFVPARPDLAEMWPDRETNPHRKCVEHIGAGEVLVVDAGGNAEGGVFGDIMTARLRGRNAAGLVVDGSLRDIWQIRQIDLPVYAKHTNAAAIQRAVVAVEMDGIINCGGVAVRPGDWIAGDPDGVVVIPAVHVAEAAAYAAEHEDLEIFLREQVLAGASLADAYPPNDAIKALYTAQTGRPAH